MKTQLFRQSRVNRLAFLLAALLPALALAGGAGSPKGPTEILRQKNEQVDHLLRQKLVKDSPEEKKQKDEIKQIAGTLLDYEELAKRSMAQHWDTLTDKQRAEFVATFKEMLEKNYVKQIRNNLDYQILYQDEKIDGDNAQVTTTIKVKNKDKSTDAEIVYRMHKVGASWMVWDIITDEVSLVRNYKTQFNKIIVEQGYDKLLDKIKSKLKEST